ncbi:uncharacterized protein TRAVEDRAFT_116349 [Trametes versicolor FP-101664 SS1]|uniref:uncharacterized protein n=1 Tax=Trametes versicolor (strain FP-101664) TaxID=717944 RepID=UPI0004622D84|nr:uncharacterized protein TRAVEDRAFT_116349 [Trametes versicolor FP-101664 SS1]EIW61726.1 hypothetical protein TRAVEDRAFT_116349 [Trametes versicolor FP-101664 SS1]
MFVRKLQPLRYPAVPRNDGLRPRTTRSALRLRHIRPAPYVTISDPNHPSAPSNVSLAHPKDPSNQAGPSQSSSSFTLHPPPTSPSPPTPDAPSAQTDSVNAAETTPNTSADTSVPARYVHPPIDPGAQLPLPHAPPPYHINPPFNTHRFFSELERSFPTPIALNLMRVTRALLVDRIGRVKRDALTVQDLESQAYLFRAALSELRTEIGVLTRNETAAMRSATSALRREVDALDGRMKEGIAQLKHEIQMDVDSRKNESKDDLKNIDLQIEEVLSKALVTIGELKTQVEESRWEKMRAAVAALGALSLILIVSMEIYVVKPKPPKAAGSGPQPEFMPPGGGPLPWVT